MLRYVWPLLFFVAAGWAWQYNGSHADRKVVFPFVDVIVPSVAGDPQQMGEVTVYLVAGLGVVLLAYTIVTHIRSIQRARAMADDG